MIGKNGRDIPKSEAESYIAGYGESSRPRNDRTIVAGGLDRSSTLTHPS